MAAPDTREVLRTCYFGNGRSSLADRVGVLFAWCLTLAILAFNASFRFVFEDGNLLIRTIPTFILGTPLFWLYARAKRSVIARKAA